MPDESGINAQQAASAWVASLARIHNLDPECTVSGFSKGSITVLWGVGSGVMQRFGIPDIILLRSTARNKTAALDMQQCRKVVQSLL